MYEKVLKTRIDSGHVECSFGPSHGSTWLGRTVFQVPNTDFHIATEHTFVYGSPAVAAMLS